jgi:hypothetical protein
MPYRRLAGSEADPPESSRKSWPFVPFSPGRKELRQTGNF